MSLVLAKKLLRLPRRVVGKLFREAKKLKMYVTVHRKSKPKYIVACVAQGRFDLAETAYTYWSQASSADEQARAGDFYTRALDAYFEVQRGKVHGHLLLKLASPAQWAALHGKPVLQTAEVERIPVAAPPVLGLNGFKRAQSPAHEVGSLTPYVAEITDVIVSSKTGFLITGDGYALSDVSAHMLYGDKVCFSYDENVVARRGGYLLLKRAYNAEESIANGIYMSGYASENFGHWVPEFLMKLKAYEKHADYAKTPIIIDAGMPQSHHDYLALVANNPVIHLPKGGAFRCAKLLVTPPATFYPVHLVNDHAIPQHEIAPLSPEGLRWLRDKVLAYSASSLAGKSSKFGKKLYLSRRNMQWRKAVNDEEIGAYLTKHGFDIIDAEKLSFEEQILMFRDAEVVVAPNGSSMLNLIFAPYSVKLLVLSQPEIYNWGCYYGPIHALGYDMLFVTGTQAMDHKHANYEVPVSQVEAALAFNMDQHAAA